MDVDVDVDVDASGHSERIPAPVLAAEAGKADPAAFLAAAPEVSQGPVQVAQCLLPVGYYWPTVNARVPLLSPEQWPPEPAVLGALRRPAYPPKRHGQTASRQGARRRRQARLHGAATQAGWREDRTDTPATRIRARRPQDHRNMAEGLGQGHPQ